MANSAGKTLMVQGRIVWVSGDLFKGSPKLDFNTKQPKLDNLGQPAMQYGFGLAIPKANCSEIWQAMHEEAFAIYPSRQLPPGFAMKYKDGDSGIDDKGVPYSQRKGYPGHLVFACTTSLPIKFFRHENGSNIMVNDGIKCGDYIQAQLSIVAHGSIGQGKPGLYINPNAVLFLGYGEPIVNAPSGDSIFGNAAPPLPPGASATPIAPQGGGFLVPQAAPVAPAWQAPQAPAAPPQPHYGVLPPQHQPQAMPTPVPYPQPGGMPQMPGMPS